MDKERIADIRNKLQTSLTTIEFLNSGKQVPNDMVNRALDDLEKTLVNLKPSIEKRFLTVPELAVYLAVSEDTIRNWKKRGEIPFSKFGRAVRFDLRRIDTWVKKKECAYVKRTFGD